MALKKRKVRKEHRFLVAASTTITKNDLVLMKPDGYCIKAISTADQASNCVGIAMETVDNSTGSDGDKGIGVESCDVRFKLGSVGLTNTGQAVYLSSSDPDTLQTSSTGFTSEPLAGFMMEKDGGYAWVLVDIALNGVDSPRSGF